MHHDSRLLATEPHTFVDPIDEPIFVLRAQDETAVEVVQFWLKCNPDLPDEKREEALAWCGKALRWPRKKQAD